MTSEGGLLEPVTRLMLGVVVARPNSEVDRTEFVHASQAQTGSSFMCHFEKWYRVMWWNRSLKYDGSG